MKQELSECAKKIMTVCSDFFKYRRLNIIYFFGQCVLDLYQRQKDW